MMVFLAIISWTPCMSNPNPLGGTPSGIAYAIVLKIPAQVPTSYCDVMPSSSSSSSRMPKPISYCIQHERIINLRFKREDSTENPNAVFALSTILIYIFLKKQVGNCYYILIFGFTVYVSSQENKPIKRQFSLFRRLFQFFFSMTSFFV